MCRKWFPNGYNTLPALSMVNDYQWRIVGDGGELSYCSDVQRREERCLMVLETVWLSAGFCWIVNVGRWPIVSYSFMSVLFTTQAHSCSSNPYSYCTVCFKQGRCGLWQPFWNLRLELWNEGKCAFLIYYCILVGLGGLPFYSKHICRIKDLLGFMFTAKC